MTDETDAPERRQIYDELKVPKRFGDLLRWKIFVTHSTCLILPMQ